MGSDNLSSSECTRILGGTAWHLDRRWLLARRLGWCGQLLLNKPVLSMALPHRFDGSTSTDPADGQPEDT